MRVGKSRCQECNRDFVNRAAYLQHKKTASRHNAWTCTRCSGKRFASRGNLTSHYIQCHWYCATCKRFFNSSSNLKSHLSSSIHRPKTFRCMGVGCNRMFTCISAVAHHLESGACRSNMTRAAVNRIAIRLDGNNVITNPARLIQGPTGYQAPESTPTYATESSWNGRFYGCFLCNSEFVKLESLNQHMRSPVHEVDIYRCPNRDGCRRVFTTISGLCQHIEYDKCGVRRFKYAKLALKSMMAGARRIGLRRIT